MFCSKYGVQGGKQWIQIKPNVIIWIITGVWYTWLSVKRIGLL